MIINLGLPRTGCTSVEEACKILNFAHYSQPIKGIVWSAFHKNRHAPPEVANIVQNHWTARFVCTTRSRETWIASVMSRFPQGNHDVFLRTYDEHVKDLVAMESERPDIRILDLDAGTLGWEPLCQLMNKPVPFVGFPHRAKR